MNIDIDALQALPEVNTTPAGLRPPCKTRTVISCGNKVTCQITEVVVYDRALRRR
jgi:hypothetical protein